MHTHKNLIVSLLTLTCCLVFSAQTLAEDNTTDQINSINQTPMQPPQPINTTIPDPNATQIIPFKPYMPSTSPISGSCFATSVAFPRIDTWRCAVDSAIYDPCFSTNTPNQVVCDIDPIKKKEGIILQLTKPLPKPETTNIVSNKIWAITLADGTICYPYTGTMPIINYHGNKVALNYSCSSIGIVSSGLREGSIKSGKIYQAEQIFYSQAPTSATPAFKKAKIVNIKMILR
jgi:hypothetical protein